MKVFQFWKKYLMSFYILISSHHFILDILFKKFAKNKFLYSIKNNSPYGIKKQKNTSTWDTEVTPLNWQRIWQFLTRFKGQSNVKYGRRGKIKIFGWWRQNYLKLQHNYQL